MNRALSAATITVFASAAAAASLLPFPSAKAVMEEADRAKTDVLRPSRDASPDPRTVELLKRVRAAYSRTRTMSADFTYSVTSVKRQQVAEGTIRLMRPNLARVTFSSLREPAYPNLVASDGKRVFTFTPKNFDSATRRFRDTPYNAALGARQASGLAAQGGTITSAPIASDKSNLRLWDATPVQAFFDPMAAIRNTLFTSDPNLLRYEGKQNLNGVTYQVLSHFYANGNIAGGEDSDFEQRIYIGPDNLIYQYVLEFRSGGRPGVQVVRLRNVRVNVPMKTSDFAFKPPVARQ
ncbi:MAG: outer-membrane lipoprotein carrier protein LolA [Armatimonadota bacterium]